LNNVVVDVDADADDDCAELDSEGESSDVLGLGNSMQTR
jgi:hypothetical protein